LVKSLNEGICEKGYLGVKCGKYWPLNPGQSEETEGYIITNISTMKQTNFYHQTKLSIYSKAEKKIIREVSHVFIHNWLDLSDISVDHFKDIASILNFMYNIRTDFPKEPILIHCSAGVGRTGTTMTLYNLLKQIKDSQKKHKSFKLSISPFTTILKLRHMRMNSVETADQYIFIHKLIYYIWKSI
jgi:protein tyrosine phosphatase